MVEGCSPSEREEHKMKNTNNFIKTRTCPICGAIYKRHPALSRKDNKTHICPDCGTREALTAMGISKEEQDKIIKNIHKFEGNQ